MLQQSKIIIADTSCFILLAKIDYLSILQELFEEVTTTAEVLHEYGREFPDWVKIDSVKQINQQLLLEAEVDKGEASVIALALEVENPLLILDDFKARKLAAQLELQFTGTLGVFLKAKEIGIIPSIKPVLKKIQETNFRFSEKIISDILIAADETPGIAD